MVYPEPVPVLADIFRAPEQGCNSEKDIIALDRNERLSPFPKWFMEKIHDGLESTLLNRYPVQDELLQQLAAALSVPKTQILLTSGSDAAIKALYHAYVRPGDGVVMLDPSYAMYATYARMFQAKESLVSFDKDLSFDPEVLLRAIIPGVRLVLLANPNQPTGTLLSQDTITAILNRAAEVGALVAIDEAYYPFSKETSLPLVRENPHLLIIRTFSKASGLAGLRIGFVVSQPEVIGNLFKVRSVYDVNGFAIMCASHILKYPEIVMDYVAEVEEGRKVLTRGAKELGLIPLPSATNFMVVRVGPRYSPENVVASVRRHGYMIKGPFSSPCLSNCVRVTLGPENLMIQFLNSLQLTLKNI